MRASSADGPHPRNRATDGRALDSARQHAWKLYLVLSLLVSVAYFALPKAHLETWTPLGCAAVLATVVGVRLHRPAGRRAWYLLACVEACFITGDTVYTVLTDVLGQVNPFPSLADAFYLLLYPLWAGAVLLFIRSRRSRRDRATLIDALIVSTGLGLLSWVYLVLPNFQAQGLTLVQRLVSVAYPLLDILVMSMIVRLVAGGGLRLPAVQLLVVGAVGLLAADVGYGLQQLDGSWTLGGPTDLGWVLFYIAYGTAALHPSSARVAEPLPARSPHVGTVRVLLLASVSLLAPAVLLLESTGHGSVHGVTIAVVSALLFLLVLGRLQGIVTEHRHSVRRERALRTAGQSLVAAQGAAELHDLAVRATSTLTPAGASTQAALYLSSPAGPVLVACTDPSGFAAADGLLWEDSREGGRLAEQGRLSVSPLRYGGQLQGLLLVRSADPMSLDEHGGLGTLASQVALALERGVLVEQAQRRQSEAHFRSLVQNASDLIVVLDEHGTITYATPSLDRVLGHASDVLVGTDFTGLLHPDDQPGLQAALTAARLLPGNAPAVCDWRLQGSAGQQLFFEVLLSNLLDDESVAGVVLTMRNVSERRALEGQLTHQAFHDDLTGLPNRVLFQDRVEHALGRLDRSGSVLAMIMLDIDDFKLVNDTRGHAAGDTLLQKVGERLTVRLRSGDTAARFGGDEFALLLEDIPSAEIAHQLASRVLEGLSQTVQISGEPVRVRASAGLVIASGSGDFDVTEMLRCADLALYAAKERGKNQIVRYHDNLHARMLDRLTRRADLQRAIEAQEFVLHYQPIVALDTGLIVSAEALVRWHHPDRGLVPPLEFIELAEDTGLIVGLGRWILDEACAQAARWATAALNPGRAAGRIRVTVNVSGRQLQEPDFVAEVEAALRRHDLAPGLLVLELTETVLVRDSSGIPERIDALKQLGVHIAIDDFGTGYSSLAYLQQFPIDILKVDKSFVDGLGSEVPQEGLLAHAIVSLGHSLQLDVVAEGIEHDVQRVELVRLGCRYGQGFLFSRPVVPEVLTGLLEAAAPLGPPRLPARQGGRLHPNDEGMTPVQRSLSRPVSDDRVPSPETSHA